MGILIADAPGRYLMIERAKPPYGIALMAGHVDGHGDPDLAARIEEGRGLSSMSGILADTVYLNGRSIAALAREHGVSRGAVRRAIADLMPENTVADNEDAPAPELPVTLDMPGKIADFLRAAELEPDERSALDHGVTVRRGQGYTLRVSAAPAVHRQLLERCQPLDGTQGTPAIPAQRMARTAAWPF
ncbi:MULTISPECIES: hypothetical protein [Streptosporangium]|uniref:Transposase-like protein n=1 Tax=Streptosporangium brasiliense TaxID=47480 RepID=A0ABT9RDK7_9ACTN|nr:hypothetical protein [Streptosporangium brasiliense]MDP9866932.1 transposase-like protein [Streptosporangium brasiliense]